MWMTQKMWMPDSASDRWQPTDDCHDTAEAADDDCQEIAGGDKGI